MYWVSYYWILDFGFWIQYSSSISSLDSVTGFRFPVQLVLSLDFGFWILDSLGVTQNVGAHFGPDRNEFRGCSGLCLQFELQWERVFGINEQNSSRQDLLCYRKHG